MKKMLLPIVLFVTMKLYSQDLEKMRRIDSIVTLVNFSKLNIDTDTIVNDMPQLGLWTKSWVTLVSDSTGIRKFVNRVRSVRTEKNGPEEMTIANIFYFHHDSLIKVEEFVTGKIDMAMVWYYSEGKPLYYSARNEKGPDRADQLMQMAVAMVEQVKQRMKGAKK